MTSTEQQQNRLGGSTFTVNHYDDGDSGILVNESGQCSMLSDGQSVQARDDEEEGTRTVYLRRGAREDGPKSFGLLISQMARTFEADHNRFHIRHVVRNSEADLSGQVQVGDEIISANDVPAIELSFDQLQETLRAKAVLRLVLQRRGREIRCVEGGRRRRRLSRFSRLMGLSLPAQF